MNRNQQIKANKGRAAISNRTGRFETLNHEPFDDGWGTLDGPAETISTTLTVDTAKTVINYNQSPDISFDRSINPYRGCEHGCVYCYARPTHTWLGLSAGLDFESRLFYKPDIAECLQTELSHPKYQCQAIALGVNTDAYQPVERKLGLTRQTLEILAETQHPVVMISKSSLIERDLDILTELARSNLVHVSISITTLDRKIARRLEPRAAAPQRRLKTLAKLSEAGIPTSAMIAPLIPLLNDSELETIMRQAKQAGARSAAYVLLRLPHETRELFKEWLLIHAPLKAEHVMSLIRDTRAGKENDANFGRRMRGTGEYASVLEQRFNLSYRKLGFYRMPTLDTERFKPPQPVTGQLSIF